MAPAPTPIQPHATAKRLALWLGVLGVAVGWLGIGLAHDTAWVQFFDNLHWTAGTAAAAVVAWLGARPPAPAHVRWAAAGLVSYAVGQLLWDVQVAWGYTGFPAPSDAAYLALGPLLALGFLRKLAADLPVAEASAAWLDALLLTVALGLLILVQYLPRQGDAQALALGVLIAYPATLWAALASAVVTVLALRVRVGLAGLVFLLGLLGTAASWMRWNRLALEGVSLDGSPWNVGFSVSVLALAWGLARWQAEPSTHRGFDRLCAGALRLLPLVAVVVAALSVVYSQLEFSLPLVVKHIMVWGGATVIVLASVRQGMLLRDRDQLMAARGALQTSQRALEHERGLLHALIRNIPDLLWLKDTRGAFLHCNPGFEKLCGLTEEQLRGRVDALVVGGDKAEVFEAQNRMAVQAGQTVRFEEWLSYEHTGEKRFFETLKTPVRDVAGQLIGVLGLSRDITERALAQQQLRIAAIAFESHESIVVSDAQSVILSVNGSFERITGYSAAEVIGKTPRLLRSDRHTRAFYEVLWQHLLAQGSWEGEVWNRRKNGEVYPSHLTITGVRDDAGVVTHYVGISSDITRSKAAEEEIRSLAFFDTLTGLPNRRLLLDRLSHAVVASQRTGHSGAVLFLDMDSFKSLNDTLGHDVGDRLLQHVAQRLLGCVRESDTVARLGGDEFVVLLEGLSGTEMEFAPQVEAAANKMLAALHQPYELGPHLCYSSSSIGITLFGKARMGVSTDDLLKQADIAMYQAKSAGRNTLRFFDAHMQQVVSHRVALLDDLRAALALGQFTLHYQVQVDADNRPLGAEALVRWQHPVRGLVSPGEFIPLAEETGLILPLGHWVLEQACERLRHWQNDPALAGLTLAVNISARQFRHPQFAA
jgi:diguanylate cyclase (GGDEF)-like protein/PAS domain S-box-containing protein